MDVLPVRLFYTEARTRLCANTAAGSRRFRNHSGLKEKDDRVDVEREKRARHYSTCYFRETL